MEKEIEMIIRIHNIVLVEIRRSNATGAVIFGLTADCKLLRIDITNGHWQPGWGWADKPRWIDRKVTIREV